MRFVLALVFTACLWVSGRPAGSAPALDALLDEIHELDRQLGALPASRADRPDPALARHRAQLLVRAARLKQAAIQRAVATYGIDVGRVPDGVNYSSAGAMRGRDGATYVDRDGTVRVQIGDTAFRSAAWLGSSIAHEVEVHVNRQLAASPPDARAGEMVGDEIEAYDFEIASAARFGLNDQELSEVRERRAGLDGRPRSKERLHALAEPKVGPHRK